MSVLEDRDEPVTIWSASEYGDEKALERLIDIGPRGGIKIDSKGKNGNTALHLACAGGHFGCVSKLLGAGAYTESKNEVRRLVTHQGVVLSDMMKSCGMLQTPMHLAARSGRLDIVCLLLDYQADPEPQTDVGWTPMMAAARYGHEEVIKRLLKEKHSGGAHVLNEDDSSCLHIAAKHGQADCIRALLAAGLDVNAPNNIGCTPLHLAADCGHALCVAELVAHGADVARRSKGGWSALHYAAGSGREEATARLLDAGADAAAANDVGFTPQLYAAGNGQKGNVLRLLSMAARDHQIDKGKTYLQRLQEMVAREEFFESQGISRTHDSAHAHSRLPMTSASGTILMQGRPLQPIVLREDLVGEGNAPSPPAESPADGHAHTPPVHSPTAPAFPGPPHRVSNPATLGALGSPKRPSLTSSAATSPNGAPSLASQLAAADTSPPAAPKTPGAAPPRTPSSTGLRAVRPPPRSPAGRVNAGNSSGGSGGSGGPGSRAGTPQVGSRAASRGGSQKGLLLPAKSKTQPAMELAAAVAEARAQPQAESRPGTADTQPGPLIGVSQVEHVDGTAEACALCGRVPAVRDAVHRLPCLHCFHDACLERWMGERARECPTCGASADGAAKVDHTLASALGVPH